MSFEIPLVTSFDFIYWWEILCEDYIGIWQISKEQIWQILEEYFDKHRRSGSCSDNRTVEIFQRQELAPARVPMVLNIPGFWICLGYIGFWICLNMPEQFLNIPSYAWVFLNICNLLCFAFLHYCLLERVLLILTFTQNWRL